jgi:hypothetical protein
MALSFAVSRRSRRGWCLAVHLNEYGRIAALVLGSLRRCAAVAARGRLISRPFVALATARWRWRWQR